MAGRALGRGISTLGVIAALAVVGCGGTEATMFPPGLDPFEATNLAPLPAAQPGNMYPEELSFGDLHMTYRHPVAMRNIPSVHARGYIQASPAAVWIAARDPQTGRDPVHSDGFTVLAYADDPMYPFSDRTHVQVHALGTLTEWDVEWRHGVVEGTDAAPTVTSTRWQKTEGSSGISVLEGSLVLRAVAGQPEVTEVDYQYHLAAPFSDQSTIVGYLNVVFARLRDRAHNRTLDPNDCAGCPTPPAGY